MTNRNWIGGSNGDAGTAANWSPSGAPVSGDTLTMPTDNSSMNVSGNELAGDPLTVTGNNTVINLINVTDTVINAQNVETVFQATRTSDTVTMSGTNTLTYNGESGLGPSYRTDGRGGTAGVIHMAANSVWNGTFSLESTGALHSGVTGSTLDVTGGSGASFNNNGTSTVGDGATINAAVAGNGTFAFGPPSVGAWPATLEFLGPVGQGQTVDFGPNKPYVDNKLVIDHPSSFDGAITDLDRGEIDLLGLKANTWSLTNGVLDLYQGSKISDTLRLGTPAAPLAVASTDKGISIYTTDDGTPPSGHLLNQHHS